MGDGRPTMEHAQKIATLPCCVKECESDHNSQSKESANSRWIINSECLWNDDYTALYFKRGQWNARSLLDAS